MSISIYTVTSKAFKGKLYLGFTGRQLTHVEYPDQGMDTGFWMALHLYWPQTESQCTSDYFAQSGMTVSVVPMVGKTVREKIILFNQYYKHYRGVAYKADKLEMANVKHVRVTPELLKAFFEGPLQNFTLENYIKRINQTTDQMINGRHKMPQDWDQAFEKTLTGKELTEYWQHLKRLGWSRMQTGGGGFVWRKDQP